MENKNSGHVTTFIHHHPTIILYFKVSWSQLGTKQAGVFSVLYKQDFVYYILPLRIITVLSFSNGHYLEDTKEKQIRHFTSKYIKQDLGCTQSIWELCHQHHNHFFHWQTFAIWVSHPFSFHTHTQSSSVNTVSSRGSRGQTISTTRVLALQYWATQRDSLW